MSFSLSRSSFKNTHALEGHQRSPYQEPERDVGHKRVATAESRHFRFPEEERAATNDFFSRSRELLTSTKLSYRSPQMEQRTPETLKLQFSGNKSPLGMRTSLTTTNRNKVRFDIEPQTTLSKDRSQIRDSLRSYEREPVYASETKLSHNEASLFPSSRTINNLTQERSHIEDLAQRMNNLQQRMEIENNIPQASNRISTFPSSGQKLRPNGGQHFKTESYDIQDNQYNETNRSRSKVSMRGDSGFKSEILAGQDTRTEEIKFTKTYVEHLKMKYEKRVEDLEQRYKEKCKEYEEYKTETTIKLDQTKDELQKTVEKQSEELRKTQRDLEFEANKKAQEHDFEIKGLKNKIRDLEEQLGHANRKLEAAQKDLKTSEVIVNNIQGVEVGNEQRNIASQLEDEIASLKQLHSTKIQQMTEKYEKERKRLKESYEKLVDELSAENKDTYKKLNDEILKRDKRIKELEREKDDMQRNLLSKFDASNHEVQILQETNRSQKKNLEECREEILRLTSQLDDKKRESYILETQIELLKSEKSRYEGEWLKGEKGSTFKSNIGSSKKNFGFSSPNTK